ncbi:hypothetical protein EV360DRAFT_89177 [Lentinula raphanica]|nr:hypothetical protein EV360DRAFT_89177 [Lentinula raphanica]
MSNPPVSSLQLTEDQVLFLITFMHQHTDLLPPQRRNLPAVLACQHQSSSRSSYNARLNDLERRERELAQRERELERRLTEVDGHIRGVGLEKDREVGVTPDNEKERNRKDTPPGSFDSLAGSGSFNSAAPGESHSIYPGRDQNSSPPLSSRGDHADDDVDDTFLDNAFLDDDASNNLDDNEGTLVGSDFTDKWFQTQAEDLGEVEVWLAQQVDPQSPQPGSPTPSPSASSSTSFTRKRRLSDEGAQQGSQDESSVGAGDGGGGRGGGGGPGRPAHGCGRNGQGVRAHKRRKAAHSSLREEEEDDVSDNGVSDNVVSDNGASDHGASNNSVSEGDEPEGNQENTEETTSSRWTVSSVPSAASQEVRHSAMTLLLEIGLGEGTSLEFSESTAWIADLLEAVKGISWADPVSLEANNLVCLTRRLSRLEVLDSGLTFLKIMTELQFAAKINSILHHKRLCQKESGQVQKASLRPVLGKLIRDEKLKLSSLLRWYSAGSRWGRLASGGTVYLLMVIARKPSIASKLKGKRVTSTTIVELSNMLRYPQTPEIQDILRDCLVPLLIKLAQTVPLEIPMLFHKKVLKYFKLSKTLDVRNLSESDQYFDLFFQHTAMALPQLNSFWQDFREVTLPEEPTNMFSLCPLTSSYLGGSQISYESDSEDEKDNLGNQSDLPIFVDNFTTQEKVDVVFSTFSYAKSAKGKKKYPFTKNNRQTWTEEMRQKAEEGTVVKTLDELAQGMRNRFYDDKEVSGKPGCLKNSQKWLRKALNLWGLDVR